MKTRVVNILTAKPTGKTPLRRLKHKLMENIKYDVTLLAKWLQELILTNVIEWDDVKVWL